MREVLIANNYKATTIYVYDSVAFRTPKGTFTLVGTDSRNDTDEFKCIETHTYHTWKRAQIYDWYKSGKIEFIPEAVNVNWRGFGAM